MKIEPRPAARQPSKEKPAPWTEVVLVCAKCAAKLGRGRKGKTELRGEIKHALKRRGLGHTVRVVETGCLDLCPKDGQTVATARQMSEGRLSVFEPEADGERVVKVLFGRT
jgi:predicted metal-binding protein